MEKICKQCGKKFHLSSEDIGFYRRKGWSIPERCEMCRRQNRAIRNYESYSPRFQVKASHADAPNLPIVPIILILVLILAGAVILIFKNSAVPPPQEPLRSAEIFVQETSAPTEIEIMTETDPLPTETTEPTIEVTEPAPEPTQAPETEKVTEEPQTVTYYLNTYRMKFHKPDCPSVTEMNPRNRKKFYGTRDEAIAMGYSPCGNCRP